MEWVLILTMWQYSGGAAIDHVVFPTKDSCMFAANAWLKQQSGDHKKTALCVQRPKEPAITYPPNG